MTLLTPSDRQTLKVLYSMMFTESKRKYPDHPLAPKPIDVRKTSQLEGAIEKLFKLYGYNSIRRTHVVGRQLGADSVTYNPITGKRQTLDRAKWIPSTGRTGEADIHGNVMLNDGRAISLAIEVKNQYTNDRMRPEQLKYKQDFEADGGVYIVIRSISECMQWIDQNLYKKINY
jgi:hypothetical protein